MVIHNITKLVTEYLIVDDEGNQIDRRSAETQITTPTKDEFLKAQLQIIQLKEKLEIEYKEKMEVKPKPTKRGKRKTATETKKETNDADGDKAN